ncbi:MAG: DinB family protein [Gemmatimonadota bacterium]
MTRRRWLQRRFELGLAPDAFPDVIERLRGTPVRLEERTRRLPPDVLTRRLGDDWSIQENVGHLLDLEPLWECRLDDLLAGELELREADLTNRATHEANHNDANPRTLLSDFRGTRERIVIRLESLAEDQLAHSALHPRLKEPMTVVDLFFFVAEHDDHHLARITEILRSG